MRQSFICTSNRAYAKAACPWAAKIVKVDGGYMCFESLDDWWAWKGQR